MSQEINEPTTPQSDNTPRGKNNSAIYWVVIIILLCACIYLFVSRHTITTQNEQTTSALAVSDSSRKSIESDYNAALARLDELTSKNSSMDSLITNQNGEIAKMKNEITSILSDKNATASQLARAKDLIDKLNAKTKSYEEQIAQLQGENTDLTNKNQSLTQERDSTVTQNIALKKVGSVLHASNIRMEPIHLRKGGKKESETSKAKKTDVLRITFDIDENRIAESGTKDVYLRIIDPTGNMLSNAAYGSGATTMSDGSQMNYTLMKEIALQQNQPVKNITVDWHQDSDYKRGAYTIEIYNGGYKIGSGSVSLR